MKRILVPTDFSTHAENALKVAAQIAKKNNCELFILHMLELPHQVGDAITKGTGIPEVVLFIKKANEMLDKIKNSPYLDGIPISTAVQLEKASDGITNFIKKNEIDLIVMGSHGMSVMEEMLIGSNTEKVVRRSEIPVLIIKKDMGDFKAENIVFASDFSNEAKKPFKKLVEFAKIYDSNLALVMICTPNSFKSSAIAEKTMKDFIADYDLKKYSSHIYNDANIENGILNFSNGIDADLIGICTHHRTKLSLFFNGSVSEDVVNHTVKPIIALNA